MKVLQYREDTLELIANEMDTSLESERAIFEEAKSLFMDVYSVADYVGWGDPKKEVRPEVIFVASYQITDNYDFHAPERFDQYNTVTPKPIKRPRFLS